MNEREIDYEDYLAAGAAKAKYAELYSSKHKFCFTHSADYDGVFCGEIVRRFFDGKVKIIPINFADKAAKTVTKDWDFTDCDVIICDFCFDDATMIEIAEVAHSVTWIDHHISAIERMQKLECIKKIHGIWNVKHSAAYNAWCWFYNNMKLASSVDGEVPAIINDISLYDTFKFARKDANRLIAQQLGMKALGLTFGSELFDILLYEIKNTNNITYDMYENLIMQIHNIGMSVQKYNDNYTYKSFKRNAFNFTLKVNGKKLRGVAINANCHSHSFKYVYDKDKHDFCLEFMHLGEECDEKWTYGIYVMPDKIDKISAVKIAQAISPNGGGHPGAAGASTKELLKELC